MNDRTEREPDGAEGRVHLDHAVVDSVLAAVETGDAARVAELLEPLHAADVADLIEQISPGQRRALLALYAVEIDGEILSEIDESIREDVIEALPRAVLAEAVRELDTDDVVDILEDLEPNEQDFILGALESDDRAAVESAMGWPEYSAGRLMQSETVTAPQHWTVGDAIDYLRAAEWLPDQFYHVILVDARHMPVGYVTLGRVLAAKRDVPLKDIAEDSFRTVAATERETEVAYLFNKYHLISMPVVDAGGRLVGVITIDDAMNVLDEEHEEDILRLAGVSDEAALSDSVLATVKGRLPWLAVNMVTAVVASSVVGLFADTISQIVALAVLMPIVASMGGNAGTQTMAVTVRSLATRELTARNAFRIVRREFAVGALNGLSMGVVVAGVALVWFGVPMLGAVIGFAMLGTLTVAALAGIVIPMALNRIGVDPALASGPFVTTLTDVVGFFAFLGLASWLLL
jgi:magnesium transporter